MARDPKIEVSAVNLRIPESHERDYDALLVMLSELQKGVRVHGSTYFAIRYYDPVEHLGILSKYTEIDIDGDWFDIEDFDSAKPEKLEEINIPAGLKPNHYQFYFQLDPKLHVVAFSNYADARGLSIKSVGRYFKEVLTAEEVEERFGRVESDIVKSYDAVTRILALPDLKELRLIIRRPNSDDIGGGLARIIEERLREQKADEYEEILRAKGANSLDPNKRTEGLAVVAAENGQVKGKSLVNGVMRDADTSDQPLTETTTYKPDVSEIVIFKDIARKLFQRVAAARASLLKADVTSEDGNSAKDGGGQLA